MACPIPLARPQDVDLRAVRAACAAVAGPHTAYSPAGYDVARYGPLGGHCLGVACVLRRCWGGHLIYGRVAWRDGTTAWTPHWWNVLPDGREVDLTSDQFRSGDGLHRVRRARACGCVIHPAAVALLDMERSVVALRTALQVTNLLHNCA